jgi:hypothetical protein
MTERPKSPLQTWGKGNDDGKRYNHAFDLAFAVPQSQYEDWFDCLKNEKGMVINALQKRIRELFENNEYLEAMSGFDTYDEDFDAQWKKDIDEATISGGTRNKGK